MSPFTVLKLPFTCSDEQARAAYHECLRRHPPELDPEGFQAIQEAYQRVRTEEARAKWILFNKEDCPDGPLATLEALVHLPGRNSPPGEEAFSRLLEACVDASEKSVSPLRS